MRKLCEEDVLRIMREEWDAGVKALSEQVDMVLHSPVDSTGNEPVVSPGLKVRHKKSQIRYTVSSVGRSDVILTTPEGDDFIVDAAEFEREYILD